MKKIEDEELRQYADRIGHENYKKEYLRLYNKAKLFPNSRYSKKKKIVDLEQIKEKYKNGVSKEFINEMLGIKDMKENERSNRVYTSQIPR